MLNITSFRYTKTMDGDGWYEKPTGSPRDSRGAEIPITIVAGEPFILFEQEKASGDTNEHH